LSGCSVEGDKTNFTKDILWLKVAANNEELGLDLTSLAFFIGNTSCQNVDYMMGNCQLKYSAVM